MTAIKAAAGPFLQYDGRNEFEGHKTRWRRWIGSSDPTICRRSCR